MNAGKGLGRHKTAAPGGMQASLAAMRDHTGAEGETAKEGGRQPRCIPRLNLKAQSFREAPGSARGPSRAKMVDDDVLLNPLSARNRREKYLNPADAEQIRSSRTLISREVSDSPVQHVPKLPCPRGLTNDGDILSSLVSPRLLPSGRSPRSTRPHVHIPDSLDVPEPPKKAAFVGGLQALPPSIRKATKLVSPAGKRREDPKEEAKRLRDLERKARASKKDLTTSPITAPSSRDVFGGLEEQAKAIARKMVMKAPEMIVSPTKRRRNPRSYKDWDRIRNGADSPTSDGDQVSAVTPPAACSTISTATLRGMPKPSHTYARECDMSPLPGQATFEPPRAVPIVTESAHCDASGKSAAGRGRAGGDSHRPAARPVAGGTTLKARGDVLREASENEVARVAEETKQRLSKEEPPRGTRCEGSSPPRTTPVQARPAECTPEAPSSSTPPLPSPSPPSPKPALAAPPASTTPAPPLQGLVPTPVVDPQAKPSKATSQADVGEAHAAAFAAEAAAKASAAAAEKKKEASRAAAAAAIRAREDAARAAALALQEAIAKAAASGKADGYRPPEVTAIDMPQVPSTDPIRMAQLEAEAAAKAAESANSFRLRVSEAAEAKAAAEAAKLTAQQAEEAAAVAAAEEAEAAAAAASEAAAAEEARRVAAAAVAAMEAVTAAREAASKAVAPVAVVVVETPSPVLADHRTASSVTVGDGEAVEPPGLKSSPPSPSGAPMASPVAAPKAPSGSSFAQLATRMAAMSGDVGSLRMKLSSLTGRNVRLHGPGKPAVDATLAVATKAVDAASNKQQELMVGGSASWKASASMSKTVDIDAMEPDIDAFSKLVHDAKYALEVVSASLAARQAACDAQADAARMSHDQLSPVGEVSPSAEQEADTAAQDLNQAMNALAAVSAAFAGLQKRHADIACDLEGGAGAEVTKAMATASGAVVAAGTLQGVVSAMRGQPSVLQALGPQLMVAVHAAEAAVSDAATAINTAVDSGKVVRKSESRRSVLSHGMTSPKQLHTASSAGRMSPRGSPRSLQRGSSRSLIRTPSVSLSGGSLLPPSQYSPKSAPTAPGADLASAALDAAHAAESKVALVEACLPRSNSSVSLQLIQAVAQAKQSSVASELTPGTDYYTRAQSGADVMTIVRPGSSHPAVPTPPARPPPTASSTVDVLHGAREDLASLGAYYRELIAQLRKADMTDLPEDVGNPLRDSLRAATDALKAADSVLPPDTADDAITHETATQFETMVLSACTQVAAFEAAVTQAARSMVNFGMEEAVAQSRLRRESEAARKSRRRGRHHHHHRRYREADDHRRRRRSRSTSSVSSSGSDDSVGSTMSSSSRRSHRRRRSMGRDSSRRRLGSSHSRRHISKHHSKRELRRSGSSSRSMARSSSHSRMKHSGSVRKVGRRTHRRDYTSPEPIVMVGRVGH